MTIAERQAREAHDKENPWRPMEQAKPGGLICDLLFHDMAGHFPVEALRYFLDADGHWYQIDPPARVYKLIMNWRPAYVTMSREKRHLVKKRVDEEFGGRN